MSVALFQSIKELEIEKHVDKIVGQTNSFISSGQLQKEGGLLSERLSSEKFKVERIFVIDVIRELEFYGILKRIPESGATVVGNNESAFVGSAINAPKLVKSDYQSRVEARFVLEIDSVGLAAERVNSADITTLEENVDLLGKVVFGVGTGIETDLMFHIREAYASKQGVIKHLISYLSPHMSIFSK